MRVSCPLFPPSSSPGNVRAKTCLLLQFNDSDETWNHIYPTGDEHVPFKVIDGLFNYILLGTVHVKLLKKMMFVRLSLSETGDGLSKEWSGQEKTLLGYVPRATAAGGNWRERERRPLYKYRLWPSAEVHSDSNLPPSSSSVSFLYNSERSSQRIIQSVLHFQLEI